MEYSSPPPMTGTAEEVAIYMDRHLRDKVRFTLEACLQERPNDPIRFFAHSLRQVNVQDSSSIQEQVRAGEQAEQVHPEPSRELRLTAPLSVRLTNGVMCELRPLAHDFRRASGMLPCAEATAPPSVFPAVQYREALSSYEVASSLRQLHMINPVAPLVLVIECPAATAGAFFYQGVAYCCRSATGGPVKQTAPPPPITALQEVLGADKVSDFDTAIRAAVAESAATVQVSFLPSLQVDYLATFDTLDDALKTAMQAISDSTADGLTQASRCMLPSVLFVSYKPDSAHLTYARLLASYGPLYEAAQRALLEAYRAAQLERKRTYTFAYAREYWANVQRRRQSSSAAARTMNSKAKSSSHAESKTHSDQPTKAASLGESATPATAAERYPAAKAVKRGLLAYNGAQRAEDDVFLVVVRRLEHAAATLIQSVYRGYRCRCRYTEAREALRNSSGRVVSNSLLGTSLKGVRGVQSTEDPILPPLLHACLERLFREGDTFGSLWRYCDTSPAPESRRCWIYRPMHNRESGEDTEKAANDSTTDEQVREGWVQEELLLPPWRATQPRLHVNLLQRLKDYLDLAQCTSLHENMQLLMDSPGLSVLQRRAYDGIKSVCLNLFHVAYAELRQRHPKGLPASFSTYMRQMHGTVLGWLSTPHACSLIFRAMQKATIDSVEDAQQNDNCNEGVSSSSSSSSSATELSMRRVVQDQLATNETLIIAPHSLSSGETAVFTGTSAEPTLLGIAPQLYISAQPLLPTNEWTQEVTALLKSARGRAVDPPSPSVAWMTIASFPLCLVEGTPVAAVPRFDTQGVEGVPRHDCFVPRLGGGTRELSSTSAAQDATTGGSMAPELLAVQATAAIQKWMQGNLAGAADAGLKHHIHEALSRGSGLVYYRAQMRHGGTLTNSFTAVSPSATLVREVLHQFHRISTAEPGESTGTEAKTAHSELIGAAVSSSTPSRHAISSVEERESVTEPVTRESSLAAQRSCSPSSRSFTASHTSAGVFDCSRTITARASMEARPEEHELQVLTADDAADQVSAVLSGSSFRHARFSMRFFAGPTLVEHLDAFLDRVAAVIQESPSSSLVLAMELPSQGFYALAAALFAFRLYDVREIPSRAHKQSTARLAESPGAELGGVARDPRVSFLSGFHQLLEAVLPSPSSPRAPMQLTAVQAAVEHVSHVMNSAPHSQLNVAALLCSALQEAEASREPRPAIVRATHLVEQYALLVLLDYYLWSPHSNFTQVEPSLRTRSAMLRMVGNSAFATFVNRVPEALEWIAHVDPWETSSPDPLHLRYSNALRRWDDKHYVCFGAC
ncbi:hypothetical protein, conserved [Leishmania tarentolae]|uniref:Uncharacterized protein n=1 Tax=Leishmania tarentolae TaxID=5689 RepID=A0A640KUV4_LEITA|nr:hypothetical protein, conserved [Leishmania tarentolae]